MKRSAKKQRTLRHQAWRQGASAVEFAIILPLLITIVLGCVDFGRFASTYIGVTNAAREGASIASMNPVGSEFSTDNLEAQIREAVIAEMGSLYDPALSADLQISVVPTTEGQLKRVRVTVSYVFETLVSWPLLPQDMTLSRAVEMRVIR